MTDLSREPPPNLPAEALAEFRARKGDLWAYCTDMDVQTSLALLRALIRTVRTLHPGANDQLADSLNHEIRVLEQQADATSLTVAATLKQYLPAA
jgi:hypothetical protein